MNYYNTYKKLYPVVDTASHGEFLALRKTIGKECKSIQNIITGLKGAVDQVEKHRHKFKNIRDNELSARKMYVVNGQKLLDGKWANVERAAFPRNLSLTTLSCATLVLAGLCCWCRREIRL